MAKATVLKCDACGTWDSDETPVRTVQVAGPRFDLCAKDRAFLLIHCGVDPAMAEKYQAMVDERIGVRGNMPALSAAKDWTRGAEAGYDGHRDSDQPGVTKEEMDAWDGVPPVSVPLPTESAAVDESAPEAQDEPVVATVPKGNRRK